MKNRKNYYLIVTTVVVIFFCYIQFIKGNEIKDFKNEMIIAQNEIENQKILISQRNRDLQLRIQIEANYNHFFNNSLEDNKSIVYLYIPFTVCNDCMISEYNSLRSACFEKKYSVKILCPLQNYREHEVFFSDYGFEVNTVDVLSEHPIEKAFLFRFFRSDIKNVFILNKNDAKTCKTYFESLN